MGEFSKKWLVSALIRAIRTGAQVALSFITVGMTMSEIDWGTIGSVALVAMIYSILMSALSGLPEVKSDGTLVIDETDEEKTNWMFQVDTPLEDITSKDSIRLNIQKINK